MSCSARLPVYILIVGAFFPKNGGLVLFGLYITGIVLAILMSRLFKKFLIKGEDLPFVMELPPYRMPTTKAMSRHAWEKTSQYLKKMGGIILVASIIVWFLEYYPQDKERNQYFDDQIAVVVNDNTIATEDSEQMVSNLSHLKKEEQKRNSFIGKIGRTMEPIVRPLGFDWKIGASLISGMAAKEIVVSTLGILYTGEEENEVLLKERLRDEQYPDGSPVYTPLVAICFLLFVLIYFPCIATIAAIKNESGSWKWAVFVIFYTTTLAWIVSFVVYQVGRLII
jgi:ferrous iron transport protein B